MEKAQIHNSDISHVTPLSKDYSVLLNTPGPILKGQAFFFDCLTFGDGTERLYRNVGNLTVYAA
jgi:hypothetical protein